jgi:trimeric autotransporter adhesin
MTKNHIMKKRYISAMVSMAILSILFSSCATQDEVPEIKTGGSGTIATFAGSGPAKSGYDGDGGLAISASMSWVIGVGVDSNGDVLIADGAANTIRKVSADDKKIETIAGQFIGFNAPYANDLGDGGPATSGNLIIPSDIATDANGNIYIAELFSCLIRKVTADGTLTTIAGKQNIYDYPGDGHAATDIGIWSAASVAVDGAGNVYYSDHQNHAVRVISKSTGKVTTIAGLGPDHAGYSGDNGLAVNATLNTPEGIALDQDGRLYIADGGNSVIRVVENDSIRTYAGNGSEEYSGDGGLATLASLSVHGIAVDHEGNLYIADAGNNVIRKISRETGIITTVAGNGTAGYSGDGGAATDAKLSAPWDVAVDKAGNIYIADSGNSAIRIVYK